MYSVEFLAEALRDLERLDRPVATRILKKIHWLGDNFVLVQPEGLTGGLAGLMKLRVGDYRVIYEADRRHTRLIVHFVGHRSDVYNLPP